MRKHFLIVLAAAFGLAASQASAGLGVGESSKCFGTRLRRLQIWDRMSHIGGQRGRDIWPRRDDFRFWEKSLQTILGLLVAVKLAAIIYFPAMGNRHPQYV